MPEVKDIKAEQGIKINNILTFLVLAVMTWVGGNIELIKRDMSAQSTSIKLNEAQITHNTKAIINNNERITELEKH